MNGLSTNHRAQVFVSGILATEAACIRLITPCFIVVHIGVCIQAYCQFSWDKNDDGPKGIQDDVRKYPKVILAYESAGTGLPFRIAHKKVIDFSLMSDV